jgi:ATP-dependent RNA helicase DDX5/DBP2
MPNLIKFEKNFYLEAQSVTNRSDDEIHAFRREHEMNLIGRNIPKPVISV